MYGFWWLAALAVVVQAILARDAAARKVVLAARAFRRALAIALPASLTVHLLAAVQDLAFRVAYLAPMVLALGVARILLDVSWPGPRWRLALPAAAVAPGAHGGRIGLSRGLPSPS